MGSIFSGPKVTPMQAVSQQLQQDNSALIEAQRKQQLELERKQEELQQQRQQMQEQTVADINRNRRRTTGRSLLTAGTEEQPLGTGSLLR